jgi:MFS family permease
MRHARVVLVLLAVVFLFDLLYGPVEVALPLLVTVDLGRGAGTLGLAWAVFGVGAVISSAATGALGRFRAVGVLIVIIAAWGSCDALLGAAPGAGVVIAVMGFGGLVYGPFTAIAYTLLHRLVNRDDQAAVFAVWSGVLALSLPIGLALGGPLVALAGTRMALVIVGLLTVGLVPIAAAWLRRTGSGDPEPVVVP